MSNFVTSIKRFLKEEDGPTAVEYGVMVALIAVALIATVRLVGTDLGTVFTNVSTEVQGL